MLKNDNAVQQTISNSMYITKVYDSLPKPFEFIEKFVFGTLFVPIIFIVVIGFSAESNSGWKLNLILPIIALILPILMINGVITHIFASKDINEIKINGARFDGAPECPTVTSDLTAIASLFNIRISQKKSAIETTVDSSIDTLKKYKELADAGIITEEEYQQKKKEILQLKD